MNNEILIKEYLGLNGTVKQYQHISRFCADCREETPDTDGLICSDWHKMASEIITTNSVTIYATGKPTFSRWFSDLEQAEEDYAHCVRIVN